MSIALAGKGDLSSAKQELNQAFLLHDPRHALLLFLLKPVVILMAGGNEEEAVRRMRDLVNVCEEADKPLCRAVQAQMQFRVGVTALEGHDYEKALRSFTSAGASALSLKLPELETISLISGWKFDDLDIAIQQRLCEALYAAGHIKDASETFLEMVATFGEKVYTSTFMTTWVSDFTRQCLSSPESETTAALTSNRDTNAETLQPLSTLLLREWAKAKLAHESWEDALRSAVDFVVSRFTIYREICERLETVGRTMDATECLRQMDVSFEKENVPDDHARWVVEFRRRCSTQQESLGDTAMGMKDYDNAISRYSAALSINPVAPEGLLVKRSRAYLLQGLPAEALKDANRVIEPAPLSPWGYERKHAALHEAGHYGDAIGAFETMLSIISQSSDPEIRALQHNFVDPIRTRKAIHHAIQEAVGDSPRLLINTITGRLCDPLARAASFESLPVFDQLVSSMTTSIDKARIELDVSKYFRYGMFSHKWQDNEPLFKEVMKTTAYDLEPSPTHDKLKRFCRVVRDAGLHWAWSDTCCINKVDNVMLQEALVAMFNWYQGGALTVVFLMDVLSPARRGDLAQSIWNTRAWTLQEYHASKVVRFYTKDWELYMNLDIPNHKESPEIIAEMEEATGFSARALMALRPGLDDIREKLCLASTRQATRIEDPAYALLGIFSMSLSIVYGEGNRSLGRLLAQLLSCSGDTSILAWTGQSGSFNSCLPSSITVFKQLVPLHIPSPIGTTEMDKITATLRASSFNPTLIIKLYEQIEELPVPLFVGQRMKLPCLIFKLGTVSVAQNVGQRAFRAQTDAFGDVEIRSEEDLTRFSSLYLVHPWIEFLLDRMPVGNIAETTPDGSNDGQSISLGEPASSARPSTVPAAPATKVTSRFRSALSFGGLSTTRAKDAGSLLPPSNVSPKERREQAVQFIARLKQPFGALLLTPDPGSVMAFSRVATETLIMVQMGEITRAVLNKLLSSTRVLDVL